eukprot:scaffold1679_cov127-Isochrysis_galbana.AAC.9
MAQRGEARWLPCSSVQSHRDHIRAYVDVHVAARPRLGPSRCRSAHLRLLFLARSLRRRWHAQKVARQGRCMLQLAYSIGRPVLGHEEVGATDARRIGRPVQQGNMGPPCDILTQHALAPPPTPTHTDERCCTTSTPWEGRMRGLGAGARAARTQQRAPTDAHRLASRAGHRQLREGGTEHRRVRGTGGYTATPTGSLIRPVPSAL